MKGIEVIHYSEECKDPNRIISIPFKYRLRNKLWYVFKYLGVSLWYRMRYAEKVVRVLGL